MPYDERAAAESEDEMTLRFSDALETTKARDDADDADDDEEGSGDTRDSGGEGGGLVSSVDVVSVRFGEAAV